MREIDDTVVVVRSPVIDPHNNRAVVEQICDRRICRQRQGWMGGRKRIHIVDFAVGGLASMEEISIPGRLSNPIVGGIVDRDIPFAIGKIGVADFEYAAALRHGVANSNDLRTQMLRFVVERPVALRQGTST